MKAVLLASILLSLHAPQKSAVQVNVNAKSGEVITGDHKFRVTVVSKNPVTQVEFYVGNERRDSDTSTPYEFTVDSLAEKDGDLKLRFKAYTTENETGETSVTVKIDNGVGLGAPAHLAKAEAALGDSKWDEAITEARIALLADPKSNEARLLLARAYMGKGDTAQAQKYAEDAAEADPTNLAAQDLVAGINLQAAFKTVTNTGGDRKEAMTSIKEALSAAIAARHKVLDADVDKAGVLTSTNLIPYSDAALHAGRFNLVIPALKAGFEGDPTNGKIANRLAYAYLRQGLASDAAAVLNAFAKHGALDAYGSASLAIARADINDAAGSDAAIKDALLSDPDELAVTAAQAYIALKYVRNRSGNLVTFNLNYDDLAGKDVAAKQESRKTLSGLVAQLDAAQGARTETLYFKQALNDKLGEYPAAQRAFRAAVLAEPANYDAYIEEGNRALSSTQLANMDADNKDQALSYAEVMLGASLEARPSSAEALAGLAIVATIRGKMEDAIKWGTAAVQANPDYAAGHLAVGTAYNLAATAGRKQADALRAKAKTTVDGAQRQALETQARELEARVGDYTRFARDSSIKAGTLDKRVEGLQLTAPYQAWRYYSAGGRTPVLPQPRG
ncbi:hypothetical protein BH11ARM1_BH11ARM1_05250 [soil metagenome]